LIDFLSSNGSSGLRGDDDAGGVGGGGGVGGVGAGVEVGTSKITGRRGVYALRDYKKGEILFRIPSDLVLALSDPSKGGEDVPTPAHAGLNFIRMYRDNPQASVLWAPYLDTLPTRERHFDPTPDFYDEGEVRAMELPRAVEGALERRDQVNELAEREGVSPDDLRFATYLISSRCFQISMDETGQGAKGDEDAAGKGAVKSTKKSIRVLCPYLDLVNHSSDNPNCELHLIDPEKDDAYFAIRSTRNMKANKEILISYGGGTGSSADLLLNYGFVPEENKFDKLMMRKAGKKGGEGLIESLEEWSTTLEEDERALEEGVEGNMGNVLRLRAKLKRAYP